MLKILVSVFLSVTSLFSVFRSFTFRPDAPDGGDIIKYGSAYNQCMDIFLPDSVGETAGIVFLIHGGTWSYNDQRQFDRYALLAVGHGYIGVSFDHRKLPDNVRAAGMNEDIFDAVTALKQYLDGKGIIAGKMIVAGYSSGAHLALLYSYTHHEDSPIPIAYVTAVSAPCDLELFVKESQNLKDSYFLLTALADEEITAITLNSPQGRAALATINPIDLVTPDVPPTILIHGDSDEIVPYACSSRLYGVLRENGVDAELITFSGGLHHVGNSPEEMRQSAIDKMLAWAEIYL